MLTFKGILTDSTYQSISIKYNRNSVTISMPKSGACPVIPKTVVLRYRSWPARSMNVITLEDFSQIFTQSSVPWSGLFTTLPVNKNILYYLDFQRSDVVVLFIIVFLVQVVTVSSTSNVFYNSYTVLNITALYCRYLCLLPLQAEIYNYDMNRRCLSTCIKGQ